MIIVQEIMKREKWLESTKGVGIFLMVLGHSSVSPNIKLWIYGFHMPLFFILAGYMFDDKKWFKKGLPALLKSRAKAYLIPYVVLFFINLTIWIFLKLLKGSFTESCILAYLAAGIYSHDTAMPRICSH